MDGMIAYKNLRPRKAGLGFKLTSLFLTAVLFAVLLPLSALALSLSVVSKYPFSVSEGAESATAMLLEFAFFPLPPQAAREKTMVRARIHAKSFLFIGQSSF